MLREAGEAIHTESVGVMVGRFQVPYLHDGHMEVIEAMRQKHPRAVIFLGVSAVHSSSYNPLDFDTRRRMLLKAYSDLIILPVTDRKTDREWVTELDRRIWELFPFHSIRVYGGRDSFLEIYEKNGGRHPMTALHQTHYVSGTQLRRDSFDRILDSPDFRHGYIFACNHRRPRLESTVDIAVVRNEDVLLIRKPNETGWRFPGGFAEVGFSSDEADASRELHEETGLIAIPEQMHYLGSVMIDDWRYRSCTDKIRTRFFITFDAKGEPKAADDVAGGDTCWCRIKDLREEIIEPEHKPLCEMLITARLSAYKFSHAIEYDFEK